jgi:outer membrane lipoprotein-sorting protein
MKRVLLLALLAGLSPVCVFAETPEEKGLAIAKEAERRDSGFDNYVAELTMTLSNRQGDQSVRHIRRKILEVPGDGDKALDIFDEPADVKGTAILTYSHGLQPDDQWIYLPALKRVKRISSVNKSGPFMGSEFAFEDIASQEVEKFVYKYVSDEAFDGHDCFVRENQPAYEFSGYTRQIEWTDKAIYQPRKVVYYDRKNVLLKTLVFKDYKQYAGKFWRASEMIMENHQTGKTTRIVWNNYRFGAGVTEQEFSQSALNRVY